jgi:AraC-like DNA-binding protein
MAIATPEYLALDSLLKETSVRELDSSVLVPFFADFESAGRGELDGTSLRNLLHRVIFSLTGKKPQPPKLHPRIIQVLKLIDERPMSVVNLTWLAEQVHLSPSRLRHLFQEQTGSSLTHYLRWNTVWKGIWLWSPGQSLTEVVKAVGYHDRAHLNRAFNEVFGMNPSTFFHPEQVRLIRCDWD